MFSKLLFSLLTLLMLNVAWAADDTVKKDDAPKTWKDKLILSFHGEFGVHRDKGQYKTETEKLDYFSEFYNPTIGWKLTDNLTLSSTYEFKYAGKPLATFPNRFYRALISLSKTNVLTEKEYGFELDSGIARRYFDREVNPSTYGNNRFNLTVTKNWDKNNISLFVQYLENDPKSTRGFNPDTKAVEDDTDTWRRGYEIIPTINLQLTDKLSYTLTDDINIMTPWYGGTMNADTISHEFSFAVFTYKFNDLFSTYLQLKYDRSPVGFSAPQVKEDCRYYIGATYSITPKITTTFEIGSAFLSSDDNDKTFAHTWKKPEATVYLDAAF